MDPLSEVLDLSRVTGALVARLVAHEPWGIAVNPQPAALFHSLLAGSAWILIEGEDPLHLAPGDVVLLPRNTPHRLASSPAALATPLDRVLKEWHREPSGVLLLPGSGACARLLCASYDYDHRVAQPLLSLLPPLLHIPAGDPALDGSVAPTLGLLAREVGGSSPGSGAVVSRLVDVMLVQVLRAWLAREDGHPSWLRGLRDSVVGEVLARIHESPDRDWSVAELAAAANVSRATLTRRFNEHVGMSPLAYLTSWRMDVAARRLRETGDPIASVARQVGYASEYSFSRAFTRARGVRPGAYRSSPAAAAQHAAAR